MCESSASSAPSSAITRACALAVVVGGLFCASAALACGAPITAEEIMHGRRITEDNMPCGSNATQRQQEIDNAEQRRRDAERRRREAERQYYESMRKLQREFDETNQRLERENAEAKRLRELEEARRQEEAKRREEEAARQAALERGAHDLDEMNRKLAPQGPNRLPGTNPFAKTTKPAQGPNPFAKAAPPHPPTAAPVSSLNPNPQPAPQYSGQSQSASCSDITGLGGPALTNCNTGNAALTQARTLSKQNPVAARAKYQEAADAYRRAGDAAMADAIIAQMNALIAASQSGPIAPPGPSPDPNGPSSNAGTASQTPPSEPPVGPQTAQQQEGPPTAQSEKPCGPSLQQAAPYIAGAELIQREEPKSCAALAAAARNYREAGKIFLDGVPTDTPRESLANTCEYQKSQEMLSRSTALDERVDLMKQRHQCGEQCRGDLAELDEMKKAADAMPPAAGGGRSQAAQKIDLMILVKRFDLASEGCRQAGAGHPTHEECERVKLDWGLHYELPPQEVQRRAAAAGCK